MAEVSLDSVKKRIRDMAPGDIDLSKFKNGNDILRAAKELIDEGYMEIHFNHNFTKLRKVENFETKLKK